MKFPKFHRPDFIKNNLDNPVIGRLFGKDKDPHAQGAGNGDAASDASTRSSASTLRVRQDREQALRNVENGTPANSVRGTIDSARSSVRHADDEGANDSGSARSTNGQSNTTTSSENALPPLTQEQLATARARIEDPALSTCWINNTSLKRILQNALEAPARSPAQQRIVRWIATNDDFQGELERLSTDPKAVKHLAATGECRIVPMSFSWKTVPLGRTWPGLQPAAAVPSQTQAVAQASAAVPSSSAAAGPSSVPIAVHFNSNLTNESRIRLVGLLTPILRALETTLPPTHNAISFGLLGANSTNHGSTVSSGAQRAAFVNIRPRSIHAEETQIDRDAHDTVTLFHETFLHAIRDLRALSRGEQLTTEEDDHRAMFSPTSLDENPYYQAALDVRDELPEDMQGPFMHHFLQDLRAHLSDASDSESADDFLFDIATAHNLDSDSPAHGDSGTPEDHTPSP